jgi:hypothetical protein
MKRLFIAVFAMLVCAVPGPAVPGERVSAGLPAPQAAKRTASAADLDTLLAAIALYPDQLLAQLLLCAENPGKVAALQEWLLSHGTVRGTELQDAAAKAGFDDSYVALVLFPDVVNAMASRMDWTTRLGAAFAADRSAVFASIQRLRKKARDAGALKSTPQQDVETRTTASGQQVIVIEPANPQVVYVPQYNPQVIYTQPTTTVVQKESSSADAAVAGLIGFTAGIAIGAAMDNNYYYGPAGWRGGAYMYNDGWDDWYDAREDAREDWQDHREDLADERGDRAGTQQQQRTERQQTAQQQRTDRQQTTQQQRTDRQQTRESGDAATQARTASGTSQEARGYSRDTQTTSDRRGSGGDAFSGYSSGRSERAASSRGQKSRSSSRSGGSRRR